MGGSGGGEGGIGKEIIQSFKMSLITGFSSLQLLIVEDSIEMEKRGSRRNVGIITMIGRVPNLDIRSQKML